MENRQRGLFYKLMAIAMSASLVVGMTGCAGSGSKAEQAGNGVSQTTDANAAGSSASGAAAQEVVFHPPVDTPSVVPEEKEETVYVQADAVGRPTKKTVEVALKKIRG